jgi:hypothetical protein
MENIELFFLSEKICKAKVVNSITYIEEQPEDATIKSVANQEVKAEEKVIGKRLIGILLISIGIFSFIYAIKAIFAGEVFTTIMGALLVFFVAFLIGVSLFIRRKAVTPISAFNKYWRCFFDAPDNIISNEITPYTDIVALFNPRTNVIDKLQSFYPVHVDIDENEIIQFVAGIAETIDKLFADFPSKKESDSSELFYGVNCCKKNECSFSKINETLYSVKGRMNILKGYMKGKSVEGYCVQLYLETYFVKLGKYWSPINPIPRFK